VSEKDWTSPPEVEEEELEEERVEVWPQEREEERWEVPPSEF
jgi:hypothetical protein